MVRTILEFSRTSLKHGYLPIKSRVVERLVLVNVLSDQFPKVNPTLSSIIFVKPFWRSLDWLISWEGTMAR